MSKSIFQRPTASAWTRDDDSPDLARAALFWWRQGLDTYAITRRLRSQGTRVTEAGVTNALARARGHLPAPVLEAAE